MILEFLFNVKLSIDTLDTMKMIMMIDMSIYEGFIKKSVSFSKN